MQTVPRDGVLWEKGVQETVAKVLDGVPSRGANGHSSWRL